jgi:hypothetical protein
MGRILAEQHWQHELRVGDLQVRVSWQGPDRTRRSAVPPVRVVRQACQLGLHSSTKIRSEIGECLETVVRIQIRVALVGSALILYAPDVRVNNNDAAATRPTPRLILR